MLTGRFVGYLLYGSQGRDVFPNKLHGRIACYVESVDNFSIGKSGMSPAIRRWRSATLHCCGGKTAKSPSKRFLARRNCQKIIDRHIPWSQVSAKIKFKLNPQCQVSRIFHYAR
jgi:hypothetical protein